MRFRRREPLHARLAREGGLFARRPVEAPGPPGWMPVGMHGVPRQREWDTVVTAHAPGVVGDAAQLVVLPGGGFVVETGTRVEELAAAAAGAFEPPFRVEAVRRSADQWALGIRQIDVIALPGIPGEHLLLTVQGDTREFSIDGEPSSARVPALEELLPGDCVVEAGRLEGDVWEVRTTAL